MINFTDNIPIQSRLWIRWGKVAKTGEGLVELKNITFYGPVLDDCEPIEEKGHLFLDLTKHFLMIIPRPYIIKFEWEDKIFQSTKEVKFKTVRLHDGSMGILNKIKSKDKLLLDCSGHRTEEEAKGNFKVTYDAILFNQYDEPYSF